MKVSGETLKYDPFAHAEKLHIPIVYRDIPGHSGFWEATHGFIVLSFGMGSVLERCVLAHEIAHAELEHTTTTDDTEKAANELAATQLVNPWRYHFARAKSRNHANWARSCGVTLEIIDAFVWEFPEMAERFSLAHLAPEEEPAMHELPLLGCRPVYI
jgi:Zn-dependent peptidase ImmA (M78 family)